MPRNAFNQEYGTRQGRIVPLGMTPVGSYSFVLGSDREGTVNYLNTGDKVVLSQTADCTGLKLVRFVARLRAPAARAGHKWTFTWGVDGIVRGYRHLLPGRTVDMQDGVIDLSQLAPGNHVLELALTVNP